MITQRTGISNASLRSVTKSGRHKFEEYMMAT